jgi:hypothetical protein
MENRALKCRFFYSHDAGVDVACEIVRLELPPALLQHEDGAWMNGCGRSGVCG